MLPRVAPALALAVWLMPIAACAQDAARLVWYPSEPPVYSRFEVRLDAERGRYPFDPKKTKLEAQFHTPAGRSVQVDGFYYEPFTRVRVRDARGKEKEDLVRAAKGSWRIRYCPTEMGRHQFTVAFRRLGQPDIIRNGEFTATEGASRGFVRVEPVRRRYFEFDDRTPLFLLGECCCWGGPLGTFSYDEWFEMHRSAGMNFARIWMSPWAFGIEAEPGTLRNYRMDQAWALDYVVELAERTGTYLMICFDYHGMLQSRKDQWGKNDRWRKHPYHTAHAGPCRVPGDFFTHPAATEIYKNRLRYIISRWAYSTHILAWELWNEVDLCFREEGVSEEAVTRWHEDMGAYVKRIDPNRHLLTTSFCSGEAGEGVWRLPQFDFTQSHCYNQPDPPRAVTRAAQDMYARFSKPTFVGEYGVASAGSKPTIKKDPLGQALHQALWSSTFSGSAAAAMPWWWDNYIHPEGLYVVWRTLSEFLDGEPIGSGLYQPAHIQTQDVPAGKPACIPGAPAFTERVLPETDWDADVRAEPIVFDRPRVQPRSKLFHAFVYGTTKRQRRRPLRVQAWFAKNGSVKLHVNSVSKDAVLVGLVDGRDTYTHHLRDKDRKSLVCGEYNRALTIPVPEGWHEVSVENRGHDWAYLDWLEAANVLPISGAGHSDPVRAYGLASEDAAWVWLLNPEAAWPSKPSRDVQSARVTLSGLRDGAYQLEWWDPASGTVLGRGAAVCSRGRLVLLPPGFLRDIAVKVKRAGR